MPRRRKPQAAQPTDAQVAAFAAGADRKADADPALNPDAPRNFKAMRVPFNEYEHGLIEALAKKTGRSKLNLIRWAVLRLADEEAPEK